MRCGVTGAQPGTGVSDQGQGSHCRIKMLMWRFALTVTISAGTSKEGSGLMWTMCANSEAEGVEPDPALFDDLRRRATSAPTPKRDTRFGFYLLSS